MKDVIILKNVLEKERQLVVRNAEKIALVEIGRTLSPMDLDGKYMWAISNVDIDAARDLGLTGIKKHWRLAGQIEKKVNGLHRDQIPVLAAFVQHSQKTHDNEKMTENMKMRQDIDPGWVSSLFVQLHGSIHCWKMYGKDIADATKLVNKLVRYSLVWGTNGRPRQDHIQIGEGEPIYEPTNEKKPWNRKQIGKLLLIVTVADPERFTAKSKPITYTGAFVKRYKQRNRGQVHEIHGMVELDKWHALMAENPRNLGAHCIIEVSLVLRNTHVVPRDQDRMIFYINNQIDWNQFNQLYDADQFNKGIRNADAVARKLRPASIKTTNLRLEVAKKEVQKKHEVVERRKAEAAAAKQQRDRRGISSSNEDDDNYYSDTDDTDPDQEDNLNPVQGRNGGRRARDNTD